MTVVVGTAGHIDHGKTALLQALTGIDADRLPEEQRRGMTLDVGYAHLVLPNGRLLDFVDVPGHDRLVGNMLVGAGEIDGALLVVAADDGPRAQTLEHLALLDGLGIEAGLAVITKADLVSAERLAAVRLAVGRLLSATRLARAPVLTASAVTGEGLPDVHAELAALEERLGAGATTRAGQAGTGRLPIDRVFSIRGRGIVVTGTMRGSGVAAGDRVRIEPEGLVARVREVQVHGEVVRGPAAGGRTALNLGGVEAADLRRGQVAVTGAGLEVSDRLLVAIHRPAALGLGGDAEWPPRDGTRVRLHLGTDQVGARIGRGGREAVELGDSWTALLRLEAPIAAGSGDRFVVRRPSPGAVVAGGVVIDAVPPSGAARRRVDASRLGALLTAVVTGDGPAVTDALTELHGALVPGRAAVVAGLLPGGAGMLPGGRGVLPAGAGPPVGSPPRRGPRDPLLARDVAEDLAVAALSIVAARQARARMDPGMPLSELRTRLAAILRRLTGIPDELALAAAGSVVDGLVAAGRLAREGDLVRDPARPAGLPADLAAAMDRLERLLAVPAPPALGDAAREAGCPPEGIRALEAAGRIVRLDADLAWSASTFRQLAAQALAMARRGPLSPAAFRDATGTSRRYVLAILEDLDRRGILQRGPDGHRPGPRAPSPARTGEPVAGPPTAPAP